MPARKKTFADFVADGTFLARRHAPFLESEPLVADTTLAKLQRAYARESSDLERVVIARRFEKAVRERASRRRDELPGAIAGELKKLGRAGTAARVVNFFPRFLRWDDGSPFVLDGWQQALIREAYRRDRHRRRIYKEILLGVSRGEGKTPLATGLGLHALLDSPGRPKVFQAAGSGEQAGLGIEYASGWIEDGDLSEYVRPPSASRISRRDGRGYYTILRASGGLAHGRKPNVGILDELWEFTTYAQTQVYTAIETALHKIPDSFLFGMSTAGYDKTSLLGKAYTSALEFADVRHYRDGFLTIARDVDAGRLMWWYGMPEGYELDLEDDKAVLRALKLAHPGSWVDHRELLRALRRTRDVNEWLRLALNAWTKTKGVWLPHGIWARLETDTQIPAGAGVHVFVDAAHSYDTTAVAWAWRSPTGRIIVRGRVFSVREGVPAHEIVPGDDTGSINNEELVEPFVHGLVDVDGYRVLKVGADPNYFGTELRHLARRFETLEVFPQSNWMRAAVQEFFKGSLDGRIGHDGDPVAVAHVGGIEGSKDENGYWRIRKLRQSSPIDLGVAMIGAFWLAATEESFEPWAIIG